MHSWRNRTAVSPERSPTEGTPLGCRSPMKVAKTPRTTISYHHALVAQLDSVSASDAEGCGFDPRRVHQSPLFRGLLHSAGEQPFVRPTPKAAQAAPVFPVCQYNLRKKIYILNLCGLCAMILLEKVRADGTLLQIFNIFLAIQKQRDGIICAKSGGSV